MKIKYMVMAVLALSLVSCGADSPTPMPEPTTVIDVAVIQMCLDTTTTIRYEDKVCADQTKGFTWVYLVDYEGGAAYIPATGQKVQPGRWKTERPVGVDIELAPSEGAYFAR